MCETVAGVWSTFQHDVRHSGQNSDEAFGPPLTLAWAKQIKPSALLNAPAIENGRAFVSVSNRFSPVAPIYALSASDGSELWSYNFGSVYGVGAPAVFDGRVYLAHGKDLPQPPATLWSFEAANGASGWRSPLNAEWDSYAAPIVSGGRVFVQAGVPGGISGYLVADGERVLLQGFEHAELTSPSYFLDFLYTLTPNYARRHHPATGAVLAQTELLANASQANERAIVFGATLGYFVSSGSLVAIDPLTLATSWSASSAYALVPAVADDFVYAVSRGQLLVHDALSGELKFSFAGDGALNHPPVASKSHVYVASDERTYVLRIGSHELASVVPRGGALAVAAHRLFIANPRGLLSAYALSP